MRYVDQLSPSKLFLKIVILLLLCCTTYLYASLSSCCLQLSEENLPAYMHKTLIELGIGTYTHIATVGGVCSVVHLFEIDFLSFFRQLRTRPSSKHSISFTRVECLLYPLWTKQVRVIGAFVEVGNGRHCYLSLSCFRQSRGHLRQV